MFPGSSELLEFRKVMAADLELLHTLAFGREEVTRYLQWKGRQTHEQTRAIIAEMVMLHKRGEKFFWAALQRQTGALVGVGSIRPDPKNETAWVGFLIVAGKQRQGYGTELLQQMEGAVWRHFPSVSAFVERENDACRNLLKKRGFVEEGADDANPKLLIYRKRVSQG